jgi:hypothetical protein
MNKHERENRNRTYNALQSLGFTFDECEKLRRISMTLHRWHELECGDGDENADWAIERDQDGDGQPYMVTHIHPRKGISAQTIRTRVADRENGAKKRLAKILESKPGISSYIQGDPRGAALYILRPGDIPEGKDAASYYNRGICVY